MSPTPPHNHFHQTQQNTTMSTHVVLFSKYPLPGKSKTRLIPALGEAGAAYAQVVMTEKILEELQRTAFGTELFFAGESDADIHTWLGRRFPGVQYTPQAPGDLGCKISAAFETIFKTHNAENVIIVGADIPGLSKEDIEAAAAALSTKTPFVLQAATDGGYVLVGVHRSVRDKVTSFFSPAKGITWGTETVLKEQIAAVEAAGVVCTVVGKAHNDVDYIEDLVHLREAFDPVLNESLFLKPKIGIVCPILNEGERITECLKQWLAAGDSICEVVFSDGGSTDGTVAALEDAAKRDSRIKIVAAPKGRGAQIHSGIAALSSESDVVFMVHADTVLPERYSTHITDILRTPGVVAGAFTLALDEPTFGTNIAMYGAYIRSRYFETPYGDQALFVWKKTIAEQGSVRADFPLLEDLEFVSRLRKVGRVVTSSAHVLSSARRYQKHGVLKVTAANQVVLTAFSLGVPPAKLFAWYYRGVPGYWIPYVVIVAVFVGVFFLFTQSF